MKLPKLAPLGQGIAGTHTPMRDPTYITLRLKRLANKLEGIEVKHFAEIQGFKYISNSFDDAG